MRLNKFFLAPRLFVLALFCALWPDAQAVFKLNVTSSPTRVSLGGTVTYSITVSNSVAQVQSVQVVNQFPASATIINAQNNFSPGRVTTNSSQVVFAVDLLPNGSQATFNLQLQPASVGSFTNNVTVQTAAGTESPVSTNVVVTVAAAEVDLGIAVLGLPPTVVVGDVFNYTVSITNSSGTIANGVNVQSVLSTGLNFLVVTPSVPSSFVNNTLLLAPGALTNGAGMDFVVSLQAVTNGNFNFTTSVTTTQNSDTTTNNNTVSSSVNVLGFVTNTVAIVSVSPMVFNRQTALMDQLVVVTNLTTNVIQSVRVFATNLVVPNSLFNAAGTNNGRPYVVVPLVLQPTNTAAVNLQFFITNRTATEVGLVAAEGPNLITLTLPTGTAIPITRVLHLRNGKYSSVYLEFPTTAGRKYSLTAGDSIFSPMVTNVIVTNIVGANAIITNRFVTASTNGFITNRVALYPPIVANSTHGQFIDAGPQVTGNGDRFYIVIEQP
jgi:uncharacterized repeat protein (TIGR01451 family)